MRRAARRATSASTSPGRAVLPVLPGILPPPLSALSATTAISAIIPGAEGAHRGVARDRSASGPDGAYGVARLVDAVDPHVSARVRGVHHLAVADVDADVVDRGGVGVVRGVEEQVAALELAERDVLPLLPLVARVVQQAHAGPRPGLHREARAVVGVRACATPLVGLAELAERPVRRDVAGGPAGHRRRRGLAG